MVANALIVSAGIIVCGIKSRCQTCVPIVLNKLILLTGFLFEYMSRRTLKKCLNFEIEFICVKKQ